MEQSSQEIVNQFIEDIGKLKQAEWKDKDPVTQQLINAYYKQGISDVQTMLEGEFKSELEFATLQEFALEFTFAYLQEEIKEEDSKTVDSYFKTLEQALEEYEEE